MHDLVIANGIVVDGTGAERRRADIGIKDGKIAEIGEIGKNAAEEVIDADGRIVSPGFVDLHTHYDAQLFWDPTASPSPFHGVTTVLGGFCGFGLAPLNPDATDYLVRMLSQVEDIPLSALHAGVPCDWTQFSEFAGRLRGNTAVNAGFSIGHSAVRRVVMGERAVGEQATPEETARMQDLVRSALAQGALGFSTSHSVSHNDHHGAPVPSRYATIDEFKALAAVCGEFEGSSLEIQPGLDYDEEACEIVTSMSVAAQRTLNWNLIAVPDLSDKTKARIDRQLAMSDYARERGGEVVALTLPTGVGLHMDLYRGGVFDIITGWDKLFRMSREERLAALRDPSLRAELVTKGRTPDSAGEMLLNPEVLAVEQGMSPESAQFNGKTIAEIGRLTGKDPYDAMFDLALGDGLKTLFTCLNRDEDREAYEFRVKLWRDDRTVIGGSDAGAHVETIDSFAYFTQMIAQAVRRYGVIELEECIQMLTQGPARLMGLRKRGELRSGWHADITIFDEATIARGPIHMLHDFPTGASRLYAEAEGIDRVIVGGVPIVERGRWTGAHPGTLLERGRDTRTVGVGRRAVESELAYAE